MLCEHYERKLVATEGHILLGLTQIGDPVEVVRNYYEEKIESLPEADKKAARHLIEDGLVSEGEAMRLSLHEAYIAQEFKVHKDLLEKLVDSRLLRSEPFLRGGYTYELSHDRLVAPVLNARNVRRSEEAQLEQERLRREAHYERIAKERAQRQLRMVRALLAVSLAALLLAVYFGYNANRQKKAADTAKIEAQKALDNFLEAERKRKETEIESLLTRADIVLKFHQKELAIIVLQNALKIDSSRADIRKKLEALQK